MRFYQGLLPAVIWDPKVGAPMVEFKNGIFDTEDEEIIERLYADGYLVEEDLKVLEAGGRLEHGGFTDGTSIDGQLPSGKPPVEEPEKFGGQPLTPAGNVSHDNLPADEEAEMATITQAGNIRHGRRGPVTAAEAGHDKVDDTEKAQRAVGKRKRKKVAKTDSSKKSTTMKKKKVVKKSVADKTTRKKKVRPKKAKVSKKK